MTSNRPSNDRTGTQADEFGKQISTDDDTVHVHLDRSIALPLAPPGWFGTSRVTADAVPLLRVER